MRAAAAEWLIKRYGFSSTDDMRQYLSSRGTVADLGCGGGFSTSLWMDRWDGDLWVGVDISTAIDIAKSRLGHHARTAFVQADLLALPFGEGIFDAAISEGVLHHTPSTRQAIASAARLLKPRGELLFYVYKKKGPAREFTDDHIRERVSALPPEDAWEALRSLTELGKSLSEVRSDVDVPVDVPLLGIRAGTYDIQRLFYYHVVKVFWNEAFTFEENLHVNFDWFHPRYAHRQTEEEVRDWCAEAGLAITWFDDDPSGFTVRAVRDGP
jgi:arsenite methyltransferase